MKEQQLLLTVKAAVQTSPCSVSDNNGALQLKIKALAWSTFTHQHSIISWEQSRLNLNAFKGTANHLESVRGALNNNRAQEGKYAVRSAANIWSCADSVNYLCYWCNLVKDTAHVFGGLHEEVHGFVQVPGSHPPGEGQRNSGFLRRASSPPHSHKHTRTQWPKSLGKGLFTS